MRPCAISKNKNQFVARAVKRSHPAVVLHPHAKIKEGVIFLLASRKQLARMSPVHADEMNRTARTILNQQEEARSEKLYKLSFTHLASVHCEFAIVNGAFPANVAVDGYVVRRINKHHIRALAGHQCCIGRLFKSATAQDAMFI